MAKDNMDTAIDKGLLQKNLRKFFKYTHTHKCKHTFILHTYAFISYQAEESFLTDQHRGKAEDCVRPAPCLAGPLCLLENAVQGLLR